MNPDNAQLTRQLQELYELSLSVGRSLEPQTVCSDFLNALMQRRSITYCAVWLSESVEKDLSFYKLIYAMPSTMTLMQDVPLSHPGLMLEVGESARSISDTDGRFHDWILETNIHGGNYATCRLRDIGRLRLYSANHPFLLKELRQLEQVIDKFAIALQGAISFERSLTEIAEKQEAQWHAEQQQQLLQALLDAIPDLIYFEDASGHFLGCNPAFEEFTGIAEEELIGQHSNDIASDSLQSLIRCNEDKAAELPGEITERREQWVTYPDGKKVLIDTIRSRYFSPDGNQSGTIGISRDITDWKNAEETIYYLANHDTLTDLPNSVLLHDRFDQAVIDAKKNKHLVALIFLDLDNFKTINDTLGHSTGDDLLKDIVVRLLNRVPENHTISRQGGDEFLILLPDVQHRYLPGKVADEIQRAMAEPFFINNKTLHTSFSMGISFYPDDGQDYNTVLQKADTAMYSAKRAGRNTYRFFNPSMQEYAEEHLEIQNDLRNALKNREFQVYYQPKIDCKTRRVVGAEALLRWIRPDKKPVSPAVFIPIAEETGLILDIGKWVMDEACRQAVLWQQSFDKSFTIAVNVSVLQFKQDSFIESVKETINRTRILPNLLELEITESLLLDDTKLVIDTATKLRAMGILLAMDDFGTGYSSLSYLKRISLDHLKIDRSFISGLHQNSHDALIVEAIIQMAHSLNLKVIAEGVEEEQQMDWLTEKGCEMVQGFFYSMPLPAAKFEESFFQKRKIG